MQNKLDDGSLLYTEYTDMGGFVIRELARTNNPNFRYQVGHFVMMPMVIPIYSQRMIQGDKKGEMKKELFITGHRAGDEIQKFHLHGYGRTREEALDRASNKLIRADIARTATNRN
jgi:hypothetical protein